MYVPLLDGGVQHRAILVLSEAGENEQRSTAGNGGVGHVERRPMIARRMNIDEIDHGTEGDAIDEISDRATEYQRQR